MGFFRIRRQQRCQENGKPKTTAPLKKDDESSRASETYIGGDDLVEDEHFVRAPPPLRQYRLDPPEVDIRAYETEEERKVQRLLQEQRCREIDAEERGLFTKYQRVSYYHRVTNTWFRDAHVVDVHFDDGPEKPYYVSEILFEN